MAAGTAVFAGITKQAGTIYTAAMEVLRATPILMRTVSLYRDTGSMAPRRSQRYGAVAYAAVDEVVEPTYETFDPTVLQTITPDSFVASVPVSDDRLRSEGGRYLADLGMELGAGAADHMDANIATTYASLTGGTITKSSGAGTITWQDVHNARAILSAQKVRGPYILALHPYQWRFLLNEATGNGNTGITNAPVTGDLAFRQPWADAFFVSNMFPDLTIVVSPNVKRAADGTAGTAALYSPMAVALDVRQSFELEPWRHGPKKATYWTGSMSYGYGIWDPVKGVTIIGNATVPTT